MVDPSMSICSSERSNCNAIRVARQALVLGETSSVVCRLVVCVRDHRPVTPGGLLICQYLHTQALCYGFSELRACRGIGRTAVNVPEVGGQGGPSL